MLWVIGSSGLGRSVYSYSVILSWIISSLISISRCDDLGHCHSSLLKILVHLCRSATQRLAESKHLFGPTNLVLRTGSCPLILVKPMECAPPLVSKVHPSLVPSNPGKQEVQVQVPSRPVSLPSSPGRRRRLLMYRLQVFPSSQLIPVRQVLKLCPRRPSPLPRHHPSQLGADGQIPPILQASSRRSRVALILTHGSPSRPPCPPPAVAPYKLLDRSLPSYTNFPPHQPISHDLGFGVRRVYRLLVFGFKKEVQEVCPIVQCPLFFITIPFFDEGGGACGGRMLQGGQGVVGRR